MVPAENVAVAGIGQTGVTKICTFRRSNVQAWAKAAWEIEVHTRTDSTDIATMNFEERIFNLVNIVNSMKHGFAQKPCL